MKQEYFWSLVLEPGWLQAGIWTLEEGNVKIISTSEPIAWESGENLAHTADAALAAAIQEFPEDAKEPSRTVFGVRPDWVEDGRIKKDHLDKIRDICSKLSLSPTGFVVLPEAIAHSIKIKDASPLTGVVIGISELSIDVSVFRLGNMAGSVTVGRSASLVEDLLEGLARFSVSEAIPTRFLLYNGKEKELEDAKQTLIAADWDEIGAGKIKILHAPQVEIIGAIAKTTAVSIAGASEMGEVKGVIEMATEMKSDDSEFVHQKIDEESNVNQTDDLTPEDVGFVVDGGVNNEMNSPVAIEPQVKKSFSFPVFKLPSFSFLKRIRAPKLKSNSEPRISKVGYPDSSKIKKIVIGLTVLFIVSAIGLGIGWWYLPHAEIAIFIAPRTLEQMEVITLREDIDSSDVENRVFPAVAKSTEISGEKTVSATGTKTVGEKAKGKVTIRNGTSTGIKLNSGTTLVGPNNLKFVIDETASISAAVSPSSPGTQTLSATASDIGSEYNLAKDESLTVGNFPKSEVDAEVSEEFSGGSSREVVAASEKDIAKLEEDLTDELKKKGINKLEGEIPADAIFISDAVKVTTDKKEFSAKVGEETDSIILNLSLKVEGLTIPKSTIDDFTKGVLASQVPDGFTLKSEQVETNFELVDEVSDGVWDFDVTIIANLLPNINPDEIKRQVSGKYPPQAQNYLSSIPGYTKAEVKIKPRFPGRLGNIPRVLNNISVEVVADR